MSSKKSIKRSKSIPNKSNNNQQQVVKGKRPNVYKKSANSNNTSLETLKQLSDLSSLLENEQSNEFVMHENGSIEIFDLKQKMNDLNLKNNDLMINSFSKHRTFNLFNDCSKNNSVNNSSVNCSSVSNNSHSANLNMNQNTKSRLPSYVANRLPFGYKQASSSYQLHQSLSSNILRSDSRLSNSSLVRSRVCNIHNSHLTNSCSNTNKKSVNNQCLASDSVVPTASTSSPATPSESRKSNKQKKNSSIKKVDMNKKVFRFEEYMPLCKVQNMLSKGQIVEGVLRINPRNFEDAYISAPVQGEIDIRIYGKKNINRAFNNDLVAVEIRPIDEWNIMYDVIQANWPNWKDEIIDIFEAKKTRLENKLNDLCLEGETINFDEAINLASNEDYKNNTVEEELDESEENDSPIDSDHYESAKEDFDISYSNFNDRIYLTEEFFPDDKPHDLNMAFENKMLVIDDKIEAAIIGRSVYNSDGINLKSLKPEDLINCSFHKHCLQQTGKVVHILKTSGKKIFAGRLRLQSAKSNFVIFETTDKRVPNFLLPISECPTDFYLNPHFYKNSLFLGQIRKWPATSKYPFGKLLKIIGSAGEIETETEILLIENNVDTSEFPSNIEKGLPITLGKETYDIPAKEIKKRRDIRDECVFTIDPINAHDLDDALSIKKISKHAVPGKEIYEVGVHISDVSYFVKENLPVDEVAKQRTTSIYCVQKVIPMLPRILSEKYCSLHPGKDKLTFSVFWHMNVKGEIVKEWFERTVIKSCIKLSYEMVEDMIENRDSDWNNLSHNLPELHSSKFSYNDIAQSVNIMAEIADNLRKKRFKHGSLEIVKPKIQFVLDDSSSNVLGFTCENPKSTIVQEFMLLANISVAKQIYSKYPNKSFLRRHQMPDSKMIQEFENLCKNLFIDMNTSTSKQLQLSLNVIKNKVDDDVFSFLSLKLLKSLRPAEYFTTMNISNYKAFQHYALCFPIYTHFTSPIRRYPDIIVHRLLAAALNLDKEPKFKKTQMDELVRRCNEMKMASRIISETNQKLFLSIYIFSVGHIVRSAVIIQVFDQAFDCFIVELNVTIRVYCRQLDLDHVEHNNSNNSLKLYFKNNPQHYVLIKILSKVNLKLTIPDKAFLLKWNAILI